MRAGKTALGGINPNQYLTILTAIVCFWTFSPHAQKQKMQIFGFDGAVFYYEFIDNADLVEMIRLKQIQKLLFKGNTPFYKISLFTAYTLCPLTEQNARKPTPNADQHYLRETAANRNAPKPTPNANQG